MRAFIQSGLILALNCVFKKLFDEKWAMKMNAVFGIITSLSRVPGRIKRVSD